MASRTDRNLIAFYRINLVLQGFLKNIPIESLQLLCGFGVANKGTTIPINLRSANTWPAAASNFGEFGAYRLFIAPLQKPLIPGPSQTSDFCNDSFSVPTALRWLSLVPGRRFETLPRY